MQIVLAHYHLNPGGVTQVMLNQVGALAALPVDKRPERIGVLYGGSKEGWPDQLWRDEPPLEVVLLPLADIDYQDLPTVRDEQVAAEVARVLNEAGFGAGDTLLHVHNHALGKNMSWVGALIRLAELGYRQLLQIHDFVEDFRPTNYSRLARALETDQPHDLAARLYPQVTGIHYATLTSRDCELLRKAGVAENRLHVLPNPVAEFADLPSHDKVAAPVREELGLPHDARLVLYPVRGIRRKNIGELLLHAAISPPNTWHAVTLAPQNPLELPAFERWRGFADELTLRCLFDTCSQNQPTFFDALAACDALITTSVAEGFGMVFLEAWLAGKPLVGRDLPGITAEFKEAGLALDELSATFDVPIDWLPDKRDLTEALKIAYHWACDNYGVEPAAEVETDSKLRELTDHQSIDFALLPSRFQEKVIRRAAADPDAARQQLVECNPGLNHWLVAADTPETTIASNAEIVRTTYSLEASGKQLHQVYESLAGEPASESWESLSNGEAILDHFLRLDHLHAIRFEE